MAKYVVAALVAVLAIAATPATAFTDVDILNFALNLECLEGQFYSWAAFGKGLTSEETGGGPDAIGGKKALLSPTTQSYAEEIATDEINHVKFLRAALGAQAVPCPLVDIGPAFSAAADVALNATLEPPFSPYGDDLVFYHGAFIFEDVGVTAYHGAAGLLQNKAYLGPAAGILGTEAYHAGIVRTKLAESYDQYVFPYGAQVQDIVNAISALRAQLSLADDDQGITVPANTTSGYEVNLVPADANSIVFARSPAQVLDVVYGGSFRSGKGLFYPNGMNGVFK